MATDLLNFKWRPKAAKPAGPRPLLAPGPAPSFHVEAKAISQGFFSNLRDFLVERPVKVSGTATGRFTDPGFGASFLENFREWMKPTPRAPHSRMTIQWRPWYGIFWENLRDAIAPPKLPPIKLSSPAVQVKPIWSKDELFSRAQALSLTAHACIAILLVVPLIHSIAEPDKVKAVANVTQLELSPYLTQLPPGKDKAGGGGGGGERNPTPATKGRLPKFSLKAQLSPPALVRNPNPKLPVDPTVFVPPDIRVANPNLPTYGDPLAAMITDSQGPGSGSGFGTGSGGGVGSGDGGGVGPGWGGGIGGGAFRAGTGGVGYPQCVYCPNPTYTEEARKSKYQGTVLIRAIITVDGRATNIQIVKGLGLGLDEKAIEAVRNWRFKPALGPDGRAVAAWSPIEINFRIY